jgi:hypothetical protein
MSAYTTRIVALLLIVEAVSVFFLWIINPVGQTNEAVFAIFLAVILISLAMISNVYRSYKNGDPLSRGFLIGCCCLILIFVYVSLAL